MLIKSITLKLYDMKKEYHELQNVSTEIISSLIKNENEMSYIKTL